MPYNDLRKGRCSEHGQEYLVTVVTEGRKPAFGDFYASRLLIREMQRLDMEGSIIWLAIARYIVANPLRAGLVKKLGDYPYWDSIWL